MQASPLFLRPYDWRHEEISSVDPEDGARTPWYSRQTEIHIWCLSRVETVDEASNTHLLRLVDYPITCHFTLPQRFGTREIIWSDGLLSQLRDSLIANLNSKSKNPRSSGGSGLWMPQFKLSMKQTLYFYQGQRQRQLLKAFAFNGACMRKLQETLEVPLQLNGFGLMRLEQLEKRIDLVRRVLTDAKTEYTQWLEVGRRFVSTGANKLSKESVCEFCISLDSLKPVNQELSSPWLVSPVVFSFDIETYAMNHRAMPNAHNSSDAITIVTCVTQRGNKRRTIAIINGDCYCTSGADLLLKCGTESELLFTFCEALEAENPTILTGYNILGYDIEYINNRMRKLVLEWPNVSLLKSARIYVDDYSWESRSGGRHHYSTIKAPGRICVDMLPIIRRGYKLSTYTLDSVCTRFLGRTKIPYKPKRMFNTYEQYMNSRRALALELGAIVETRLLLELMQELYLEQSKFPLVSIPDDAIGSTDDSAICMQLFSSYLDHSQQFLNSRGLPTTGIAQYHEALVEMTMFLEYCCRDSVLALDLYNCLKTWTGVTSMADVFGVSIEDAQLKGQQMRCLSQIYDAAHERGVVVEQKEAKVIAGAGGYVCESERGAFEDVITLDFASLYPSIIRTFNICPSTFIPECDWSSVPESDCHIFDLEPEDFKHAKASGSAGSAVREEDEGSGGEGSGGEGECCQMPIKQVRFVKREVKEGILPLLLGRLLLRRKEAKGKMEDAKKSGNKLLEGVFNERQLTLKISANSFFGILGVIERPVLAFVEGSICITKIGRMMARAMHARIKELGFAVVAGDTDSVMTFPLPGRSFMPEETDMRVLGKALASFITKEVFAGFEFVSLEFEKVMKKALFLCKKKYIGISEAGATSTVKGVVTARRDNCAWIRNIYAKLVELYFSHKDPGPETSESPDSSSASNASNSLYIKCLAVVFKHLYRLLSGEVKPQELAIVREYSGSYKSPTAFMAVFAERLTSRGLTIMPGDRLEYVVAVGKPGDNVGKRMELLESYSEDAEEETQPLDLLYYIEKVACSHIDQFFTVAFSDEMRVLELIQLPKSPRSKQVLNGAQPIALFLAYCRSVTVYECPLQIAHKMHNWLRDNYTALKLLYGYNPATP